MAYSRTRCLIPCVVLQTLALLSGSIALAAEDKQSNLGSAKMAKLPVVLTDENGNAVVGAEVQPYAMRMVEEDGHGFWKEEVLGPPKTVTSDDAGVAVIEYPHHVQYGPRVLTTRLVTFEVVHTEFVRKVVHFDLGPERAEVTLAAGCEVEFSAVDSEGKSVDDFGVIMAGPYEPSSWAKTDSGGRRTRSIQHGTWQTMLVKLQEDGPTLFSNRLPLRVRPDQRVRMRNVRLMPGAKIRGTLSDNVPRPVSGYVVAVSVPKPLSNSWDEKDPSLSWHDWVEVGADGDFEFESLPRGGQVQLIGICDGWISSTTAPDAGSFVMGQLFDVADDDVAIELEMERTGTLEVQIITDQGMPLTEGSVSSWPNQRYYKGGSTFLGQRYRSSAMVKNQLLASNERLPVVDPDLEVPFNQPLGADGVAILTGLPLGTNLIVLSHQRYELAAQDNDGRSGEVRFELSSPKPVRLEVTAVSGRD